MKTKQNLNIIYHPAQEKEAQTLVQNLKLAPLSIKLFSGCPEEMPTSSKTIVLLSDNFLRDRHCMEQAPELLPKLEKNAQLILLLTPGFRQTEEGKKEHYPTTIQRTKDFMQYVNYWQQHYLELRRKKRSATEEELPLIEKQLKAIRTISANIGSLFNFLRSLETNTPEELSAEHYKKLFDLLDLQEEHPDFAQRMQNYDSETAIPRQEENTPTPIQDNDDAAPLNNIVEERILEPQDLGQSSPEGEIDADEKEEKPYNPAEEEREHKAPSEDAPSLEEAGEEADEKNGYTVEELLQKARELRQKEAHEEALQLLEQGVQQFPEEAELRYQYALLLIEHRKEARQASQQLKTALQYAPQRTDLHFLLAELMEYLDKPGKAIKHYKRVVQQEPEQAEAWQRLAILHASFFPEKKKATFYYSQAAKLNSDNAELQYLLAQDLIARKAKPKKIIKALKEVLRRDRQYTAAHFLLAEHYLKKGKADKAQAHYLLASRQQPDLRNEENDQRFLRSAKEQPAKKEQDTRQTPPHTNTFGESQQKQKRKKEDPSVSPIVLITGASSGIGAETARRFARQGYRLVLCARRKERLKLLQKELQDAYGVEVVILAFDLRKYEACQQAFSQLEGEWQNIDVLINNAGLARGLSPIHQGLIEDWETMIDTNIKGLLYMTRLVSPGMVERRRGHIINVGSTAGKEVYPNGNVYCATKFAVDALTKAMRIDLYPYGIKVGQVCPGHVETEFAKVRFNWDEKRAAQTYKGFTPLYPNEVAELIYYLVAQPDNVNIQDVLVMAKNQAGSNFILREEEE